MVIADFMAASLLVSLGAGGCTPRRAALAPDTLPPATVGSAEAVPGGAAGPAPPATAATRCTPGSFSYLGFEGRGVPTREQAEEITRLLPGAAVVLVEEGKLGVILAGDYSSELRARHEAAGRAIGWEGNVVDFPMVAADCSLQFKQPPPLPSP